VGHMSKIHLSLYVYVTLNNEAASLMSEGFTIFSKSQFMCSIDQSVKIAGIRSLQLSVFFTG